MDTITHGIAGALIGKALFKGDNLFVSRTMNRERIVTWSIMLGAIFPDSDTVRDMLSHNELLVITWHRSITHSLICLPVFALLLAAITHWFARRRKWDVPSFAALTGIYAIGLISHVLLDLVTSFGTMIWSPVKWCRSAWDLIFIVDFTFTGILLVPQFLAWVHECPEKSSRRASVSLVIFILAVFAVQGIANTVGAPVSMASVLLFIVILSALFLVPLFDTQNRISRDSNSSAKDSEPTNIRQRWNRVGLACACAYLSLAAFAHHAALSRVKNFATWQKLEVGSIGALPFPPSLWQWDGLVRTPRGVYKIRVDLSQKSAFEDDALTNPIGRPSMEYRFYPEARSNVFIEAAKELREVQEVLWFDRFPVTRFHEEGGESIVEISDTRFPPVRKGRAAPFTYQVRFDPAGNVLSQGWAK